MGWLFTQGQSRAALIQALIRNEDTEQASFRTLAYCTKGNVLWTVQEVVCKQAVGDRVPGQTDRYIVCNLMACRRNDGWGYKNMDESMHPFYYSCPLSYLDMVPEACPKWRAAVREYHARLHRKIRVGEICSLKPGFTVRQVQIVSVTPLHGIGRPDGLRYRLRRNLLADRLDEVPA